MKKLYTLLLLCISLSTAQAQDTLKSQDLPNSGNMYVMSTGTAFTGMTPDATGPNYVWDYSQLTKSSQTVDTMFSVLSTNFAFVIFFGISPNQSNLAANGQNFNLGATGITNVFNFYNNTNSQYVQTGFGAILNAIPIPVAYTPHDVLYKFPLKYNDEDSVSYTYQLDLTTTLGLFYGVKRSRHNLVDGWGTLTTPYGTFNVERIKSTILEQDSVYIDTFHLGTNLPPTTTIEYKWMGKGFGLPLLQINTTGANAVTQILYQDSTTHVGISEAPSIISEPQVFPNPASDKLIIHYSLVSKADVDISLYSLEGKEIFSESDKSQSAGENFKAINLHDYNLAPGNYFIKLKAGSSTFVKQVEICN